MSTVSVDPYHVGRAVSVIGKNRAATDPRLGLGCMMNNEIINSMQPTLELYPFYECPLERGQLSEIRVGKADDFDGSAASITV